MTHTNQQLGRQRALDYLSEIAAKVAKKTVATKVKVFVGLYDPSYTTSQATALLDQMVVEGLLLETTSLGVNYLIVSAEAYLSNRIGPVGPIGYSGFSGYSGHTPSSNEIKLSEIGD